MTFSRFAFLRLVALAFLLLAASSVSFAQTNAKAPAQEDWTTPTEASGYRITPRYDETHAWFRRIANAAPRQLRIEVFGRTGEGRELWAVVASKDGVFDPAAIRKAGRPVVLILNGIHSGEIEGKDASMALLRDMLINKSQAALLDKAVVIIVPIYNADGHERFSAYNRINQNGPEEMGWRTTAINLNLNRDFMKADSPETRGFLKLWQKWQPDFFFDDHVTDGADYQYAITIGVDHGPDVAPATAEWIRGRLIPQVFADVTAAGHVIGPFINLADNADPAQGITTGQSPPRFSTGFSVLQNRPGMLVEMHMLKDYRTRVLGNYELLRATLALLNQDAARLLEMNRAADAATIEAGRSGGEVHLKLEPTGESVPFEYKTFKTRLTLSEVSGTRRIEWLPEKETLTVPLQTTLRPTLSVAMPAAYLIPAQWTRIIEVLLAHGIEMKRTRAPWTAEVELYRCKTPTWTTRPFEGRHPVSFSGQPMADAGFTPPEKIERACELETRKVTFPAGSYLAPMTQRAARIAVHFLEPEGPDSAVAWGFFDAIFEQKEYGEAYVVEKLAREMMAADPALKAEFEQRVARDREFAASPRARLDFFYRRSPWWDDRIGLYPVARLKSVEGVPVQ